MVGSRRRKGKGGSKGWKEKGNYYPKGDSAVNSQMGGTINQRIWGKKRRKKIPLIKRKRDRVTSNFQLRSKKTPTGKKRKEKKQGRTAKKNTVDDMFSEHMTRK